MTRPEILGLLCNLIPHLRVIRLHAVARCLVRRMAILLHGRERLVVILVSVVADLDLVKVGGALGSHSIFVSVLGWQLVRCCTCGPLGSFNYVGLIVTHFEVVFPLRGYLGFHGGLVVCHVRGLLEAAPILRLVVELVASEGEVGLGAPVLRKNLVRILLALPDCIDVRRLTLGLGKAFLSSAFREFIMLRG